MVFSVIYKQKRANSDSNITKMVVPTGIEPVTLGL